MHYALRDNLYPIETRGQLKTASVYFSENLTRFSPSDRIEISVNLEKRASDLNINLDIPWITNYSRIMKKEASYSPEFEYNMKLRKEICDVYKVEVKIGDNMVKAANLIDKLISEKDQTEPLRMVTAISEFDKLAKLESHYDNRVMDAVFTVYGSLNNPDFDLIKLAECKNKIITHKTLKKAASNPKFMKKMSSLMGKEFIVDFQKSPIDIFKSMPHPEQQLMIEKMADTFLECEECEHREDIDTEGIDAKECAECGGKMEEKEE